MPEIGNIHNTAQPIKLQAKEPKEARNITPADSGANSDTVRPNETQNLKVVSSSSPQKTVDGSEDLLKKAANIIERFLTNEETAPNTKLRIDRDEGSGNFIYQNVDEVSGEIISQFPTEKILQVLSFYRELEGLAVDEHA